MKKLTKLFLISFFIAGTYTTGFGQEEAVEKEQWGNNILSVNVLNFYNNNLHLGYERIFTGGLIGTKLSLNYNFKDKSLENSLLNYQRDYTAGFDFNFYPFRQSKASYFIGTAIRMGRLSKGAYLNGGAAYRTNRKYSGFFIQNGIALQPTKAFYVGLQVALGYEFIEPEQTVVGAPRISTEQLGGFAGLHLGLRL